MKPKLVAQIKFANWTDDRKLRAPVFLGLRDDKAPVEVMREEVSQREKSRRRRFLPADQARK